MLAGRRPYEVQDGQPSVLGPGEATLYLPGVPRRLARLVARAMAKDASCRPASARELADDLLALERAHENRRVRRIAIALPMLLVAGFGGFATWKFWPEPVPPPMRMVLVGDIENRTGDPVFDGTLEPALGTALEGASFLTLFQRNSAQRIADQLRLEGKGLDATRARLVAQREGVAVVTAGSVERAGAGYRVELRALDPFTGETVVEESQDVAGREEVIAATTRLAARVRSVLGDTTPEAVQLKDIETFSAASLEAAHEYASGGRAEMVGHYDEARARYLEAIRLDPGLGRAYSGLAVLEYNRGRPAEAGKYFKEALSRIDRMSEREKLRSRGLYFMFERDPDKAIESYEALLKQFPADIAGLVNLSFSYQLKRDFGRAVTEGRRALAIYPNDVPQRNNVGLFAMFAGDFDAAMQEQRKALELNTAFGNAWAGLALAQLASGSRDAAIASWERLRALPDGGSAAVEGLADVALYEGRIADAQKLLEKGIASDLADQNGDAAARKWTMLAAVHRATGAKAQAVAAATKAVGSGRVEHVMLAAALVLAEAGEEGRASALADDLDKRLAAEPRTYAEIVRGAVELNQQDYADAIARFKSAAQKVDLWIARLLLGQAYLEAGAYAQALDEFERCEKRRGEATDVFLDIVPTYRLYGPVQYYLGRAHEGLRSPAAAEHYRAFLAIKKTDEDPMVGDARARLAKLAPVGGAGR
jgi:tetratricopeptide (TPR) repeat protein